MPIKRQRKPSILEGGKRLAVSATEAAEIMGLKDKRQFEAVYVVNNLIRPSVNPKTKEEFYSIYDVIELFDKTKKNAGEGLSDEEIKSRIRATLYS